MAQIESNILISPNKEILARHRTYTLAQLRADLRDLHAQFLVLLAQLNEEKFTGQVILHFNQGRANTVETIERKPVR